MHRFRDVEIRQLTEKYGSTFYLLSGDIFSNNYQSLLNELNAIFPHFNIAYSYKTNYTPAICNIVKDLGGYAEVVSDMELDIAMKLAVPVDKIIFNGPYKRYERISNYIANGGKIHVDNLTELHKISLLADELKCQVNVAIRCNYDVNDGVVSRFGIDTESEDFVWALKHIAAHKYLNLVGIHSHIANRGINVWENKVAKMCDLIRTHGLWYLQYVDVGGGLYGHMAPELEMQFVDHIPTYREYAEVIAPKFKELYEGRDVIPEILIEPGSAVVGDAMFFVTRVNSLKNIRGINIATLEGSMYNINPTLNKKNPPIQVIGSDEVSQNVISGHCHLAGYTCIESDYLYRDYVGSLSEGDIIVFGNVGSYSVVLKPPFILPNNTIVFKYQGSISEVKVAENFEDVFLTYKF